MRRTLVITLLVLAALCLVTVVAAAQGVGAAPASTPTWDEINRAIIAALFGGGGAVALLAQAWVSGIRHRHRQETAQQKNDHETEMAQLNTLDKLVDKYGQMVEAMRDQNAILMDNSKRQHELADLTISQTELLRDVSERMDRSGKSVDGKLNTVRDLALQIREAIRPLASDEELDQPSVQELLRDINDKLDRRLPRTGQLTAMPAAPIPPVPTLIELEQIGAARPTDSTPMDVTLITSPPVASAAPTTNSSN